MGCTESYQTSQQVLEPLEEVVLISARIEKDEKVYSQAVNDEFMIDDMSTNMSLDEEVIMTEESETSVNESSISANSLSISTEETEVQTKDKFKR